MKRFVYAMLLILAPGVLAAQPFSPVTANLPQLGYSACAWSDYDHDGDLDAVLTGIEGLVPVTMVMRNDSGQFTDIQAGLAGLHNGSVEWGDFEADGDQDILLTGIDGSGNPYTKIYLNNSGQFSESAVNLPGLLDGTATWSDYDNDGDLDILLAGSMLARIYRNDGTGGFTDINAPLPAVQAATACWVDYNNDGQTDAMVCGDTGGGMVSALFRNDQGLFTEVAITPEPFLGLYGGQAKWSDLDGDGDQDLVICGMDLYIDGYFLIYRNDGHDQFTKLDEHTSNLHYSSIDLGDFDADGLTDIILMGKIAGCGGTAMTLLMQNLGFMNFFNVSALLPGFKQGGVSWGDYNNDGYSDLLFTGVDAYEANRTALFINNLGNNAYKTNTPPAVPAGLITAMDDEFIRLTWNSASDGQTPAPGLTYNLCIGTQPELADILSPMSLLASGLRLVTTSGNTGTDTSWLITGIPAGSYYFSVQTIDNGFMASEFSTPVLFDFTPVGLNDSGMEPVSVCPNPCREFTRVASPEGFQGRVTVYDSHGILYHEGNVNEIIRTQHWPEGIYIARIFSGTVESVAKVIKY